MAGIGAEIASRVYEEMYSFLKGPVRRIGLPDVPTPCSPVLENAYYPDYKDIINSIKTLIN